MRIKESINGFCEALLLLLQCKAVIRIGGCLSLLILWKLSCPLKLSSTLGMAQHKTTKQQNNKITKQ
jgi:hypothetical protein